MPYEFPVVVDFYEVLYLVHELLVVVPEVERGGVKVAQGAVFQRVVVRNGGAH